MIHARSGGCLAAVIVTLACSTAAGAHVTIRPRTVAPGSTADLAFRCPDERARSATVELVVQLPPGVRFASVTVPPVAGWHSSVTRVDGYVDTVTWSGGSIPPHAAGRFRLVVGPVPAAPRTLLFRAVQTYDDGEVVRWIEERLPGEAEPPFPAPAVEVR